MVAGTRFFRNPNKLNVLVVISILTICISGNLAPTNASPLTEHEFYLLQHYKQVYAEEPRIFDYCVGKYKEEPKSFQSDPFRQFAIGSKVGSCMRKQIKLKDKILDYAQNQLGRRSLAQGIYDECTDYYPKKGVARISKCIKTKLVLDSRLEDDIVEKKIYQKCDTKWRKHGSSAIDNCSRTEATYYREKGQLRD